MTLSYTTGLTVGSLFAYLMDSCFELPVQSKDVCYKAFTPSVMPLNTTTPSVLTNVMSSTILPTVENVTSEVKTTVTVLSTLFDQTSTFMFNSTVSTFIAGVMKASSTVSPKSFNVTASVNNAILQH